MSPLERHRLYAFFSRLWVKELDAAFLEALEGPLGRELLPRFFAGPEAALLKDADQRGATFDADFAHLTVVNLVPYGSFFLREDGQLEAGAQNPVSAWLREYGFEVDLAAARSLAPDHLGIELEVLAELCRREHEALEAENRPAAGALRKLEREFLEQHLLPWAPLYLFAAQRTARSSLYREAAEAVLQFILSDHEALGE